MKKSNLMKFLVISLIFVISFGTISAYPMSAKAAVDEEIAQANKMLQDFYNISEKEAEQLFNEIEKAKVFYKFDSNGTVFFNAKSALKSNVSPSLVSEISLSMENAGEEKLLEIS